VARLGPGGDTIQLERHPDSHAISAQVPGPGFDAMRWDA
jgi:hypothetical protein